MAKFFRTHGTESALLLVIAVLAVIGAALLLIR